MSKKTLDELFERKDFKGLLKAFFNAGGEIKINDEGEYLAPLPTSYETSEQRYALGLLLSTREGKKLLKEVYKK